MGLGNGSQIYAPPVTPGPFSNGQWNIRNRFSEDIIEQAGGGGISARTSLGLFQSSSSFGTITGQAPTDTLPSVAFFTTSAVANSNAGFSGGGVIRLKLLNWVNFKVRLFDAANCRIWLCMTSASNATMKNDNPGGNANLGNGFGFRYSTAAGDSTIKAMSFNAAAGNTGTIIDTGIIPDTANFHLFEMRFDGTNVQFFYDGALVAGIATNLPIGTPPPGSNYSLSPMATIDNVNLGNAKAFWYSQASASENF